MVRKALVPTWLRWPQEWMGTPRVWGHLQVWPPGPVPSYGDVGAFPDHLLTLAWRDAWLPGSGHTWGAVGGRGA